MQYLFHLWDKILATLRSAQLVLLLSDYDGTLTPIVNRPEDAILLPEVRCYLRVLAQKSDFSIGLVSGRQLSEIKRLVGINRVYYAGNHGLEIEGPKLTFIDSVAKETRAVLSRVVNQLKDELVTTNGVIIEDKGLSVSLHYRLVSIDEVQKVEKVFHRITDPLVNANRLKITSGKKVWEVRPPVDWHKGKAVQLITNKIEELRNRRPDVVIYMGDDTTDEDAFGMVNSLCGWSVFVGADTESSQAKYYLASPREVTDFLARLTGVFTK